MPKYDAEITRVGDFMHTDVLMLISHHEQLEIHPNLKQKKCDYRTSRGKSYGNLYDLRIGKDFLTKIINYKKNLLDNQNHKHVLFKGHN